MALYLCRDYVSQDTTSTNRTYIHSYLASIFLRRVVGYTYVGDTNYPINTLGRLLIATGDTTPTGAPTFPGGNRAGITNNGSAIEVQIPPNIKVVASADVGRILVFKSTKYPTRNSGIFLISALQQGNVTSIAAGSNNVALPTGTINVGSTTGFPASGTFFVGASTTIASGSNNVALPTGTINVVSTTGFATSGTIQVSTTTGTIATVTYTGTTATTFTGCTGGTGTMFTGATVITGAGFQTITYTGTTATTFTGCTGGTGTLITGQSVFNQNKYVIDYRANGELPPPEAFDTLMWWLYDKDINCPGNGAGNGSAGYNSIGSSVTPRIILQSPHATGWQVRICNESTADSTRNIFNGTTAPITMAPGFGGDAAGDFAIGGDHLHGTLFNNIRGDSANSNYMCGNGLGDDAGSGAQYRYTFIADDTGQSVHLFLRRLNDLTSPAPMYFYFGIPDNEPTPLPIKNIERLFVVGAARGNTGNGSANGISFSVGTTAGGGVFASQGTAFRYAPIACAPSALTYVLGNNQLAGPTFDSTASDCPFISATELMTVDLVTGIINSWSGATDAIFRLYPRVIGTVPLIRTGRANFGNFTLTTDTGTWSVTGATNASPIQITTSTTNTLVTGQTVAIHSVGGNTAANGTFTVTVINGTQFTLDGSTGNGAFTSGGTVLRGASWQHMRNGVYMPWNGPSVVA